MDVIYLLSNIKINVRIQFPQSGTNEYDSAETGKQPQFAYNTSGSYKYTMGVLKWAKIFRSTTSYTGWVLCWPNGEPMTWYELNAASKKISVSCTGSYITE